MTVAGVGGGVYGVGHARRGVDPAGGPVPEEMGPGSAKATGIRSWSWFALTATYAADVQRLLSEGRRWATCCG